MRLSSLTGFLRRRRRVILASLAGAVAVAVAGTFLAGYVTYREVAGEVHHVTVSDLGKRPPVYSTTSENILIVGSDSRAGLDRHQQVLLHTGDDDGDNTDTIMLVHISPGGTSSRRCRSRATRWCLITSATPAAGMPASRPTRTITSESTRCSRRAGRLAWKTVEQQTASASTTSWRSAWPGSSTWSMTWAA